MYILVILSLVFWVKEQRLAKKNELKARGTLLMALLDKHQLKLNIHKDAKSLTKAIKKRFGGNKETKKVQKTLLKQKYENFSGTSFKILDRIHDRLQKLISQLEILSESISQEDINLKFLRSLPSEWKTHTLIWRNKVDLEEQSLDDLFNNLKIYETEVNINDVPSVSAASTKALVSTLPNVDSLSDAVIYSFFASQYNSPQFDNEDLKQIDADDLEEIDLKWQMAMLTMRASWFLQRTGRNLGANGTAAIGFDMSKFECYNYHRKVYFARECRSPRDNRNKDTPRRTIPVEVSTSNALVSQCDGVGSYDWSFQVDEEPTNYALMAFTSSGSSSSLGSDNEESDDSMPTSPVNDRYQTDKGYHAARPPYTGTFMPPKLDLVFNNAPPANWTSDSKDESEPKSTSKQKEPSFVLTNEHVKTPRVSVETVEHPQQADNLKTYNPKDCDFYEKQMVQKPLWHHEMRVNHQNSTRMTHSHSNRNVVPTSVLTRSGLVSFNTVRPVTTAVPQPTVKNPRPVQHVVNKAHLPIRRSINYRPSPKNSNFNQKVTIVKVIKVNVVQGIKGNWVWKPKCTVLDHVSRPTSASMALKQFDYTNALGRSKAWLLKTRDWKHILFLDFEEINGGYVAFGGNPKGGKITDKCKIKTSKLDFDDVYFVKELKFNLFSVSQMCDKKNNVLFTDTKCVVLSSDFKLPDENHVLLRVLRENDMYNVNLKNVVPSGDLTFLFAKTTLDESNLWHRRLGHINFKTMNKLVKGNLVRGLPSKVFENNHSCVACKKGKQHRASWSGPKWLFDIDTLTQSMNYQPVVVGNQPNHNAGIKENLDAGKVGKETESAQQYVLLPLLSTGLKYPQNTDVDAAFDVKKNENEVYVSLSSSDKPKKHNEKVKRADKGKSPIDLSTRVRDLSDEFEEFSINNTNRVNAASAPVTAVGPNPTNSTNSFNAASPSCCRFMIHLIGRSRLIKEYWIRHVCS
nr:putative ribonuclease H-like domain-containing protein [Tanacetum cinerariifolium]